MKNISGGLLTYLQSNQLFTLADLYTITLISGTVLRYTDFDTDLVNTYTYSSRGPVFKRSQTRITIGLEVDTLDLEIYPKPTDLVNGLPMLAAAAAGAFDGANVSLDRAYVSAAPALVGVINLFSGDFADLEIARAGMKARINSDIAQFNVQMPRNVFQANCMRTLYDAGCGVARATYGVSSTDMGGSTVTNIVCNSGQSSGYFNNGYVLWNTGALAGLRRTIKSYSPGAFSIFLPLPSAPYYGDTMTLYPGCDKSLSMCVSRFNNRANFRGFPFIPVPETAI
jgi:uncharacterized phage protein (TIGR02218 family)